MSNKFPIGLGVSLLAATQTWAAPNVPYLWSFQGIENVECVAQLADQDGDGKPEAVVMHYDAGAPMEDFLTAIRGSSRGIADVLWSARPWAGPSGSGGYGDRCLSACPDLDGDGMDDLLLATAWGSRAAFHISGASGSVLAYHDTYNDDADGWCYQVSPLGDVNADGLSESVAAFGNYSRSVFSFDGASSGDATVLFRHRSPSDGFTSVVGAGDLDGDGIPDAVAGAGGNGADNQVTALSGVPTMGLPTVLWTFRPEGLIQNLGVAPDVDGDGIAEIASGSWGPEYLVRLHSGADGDPIWETAMGVPVMEVVPIGDVNGDGAFEIAVGSWDSGVRLLDGASGTQLWRGTFTDDVWRVAGIGDVDGDDLPDLLAGSFDQRVIAFSGVDGLPLWEFPAGAKVFSVRGTEDMTGDGIDDVILGTQMLSGRGGQAFAVEGDAHGPWIGVQVEVLTPVVAPGETARIRVSATNNTRVRRPFDAWIGPRLVAADVDLLDPGQSRAKVLPIRVPGQTPEGIYHLEFSVGRFSAGPWDAAPFSIEVRREAGAAPPRAGKEPQTKAAGEKTTPPPALATASAGRNRLAAEQMRAGLAAGLEPWQIQRWRAGESSDTP